MRKLLYYLLIFTVIFSTLGLTSKVGHAADLSGISESKDGYYSEAFELDGVQYLYEDTNSYTLTITKASNGEEIIAYKDKLSGIKDEIYYQHKPGISVSNTESKMIDSKTNVKFTSLNSTAVKELNEIKEQILNKEIDLEKRSIDDFGKVTHLTEGNSNNVLASDIANTSKINYSLTATYGSQYTFKYLTSAKKDGYTGYLYQHMTFGNNPKTNFWFDTLTHIGTIATLVGTPLTSLLGIAAWVAGITGSYQLLKPTTFNQFNATVYTAKEVKVGTIYPYRAYYDRKLIAVTGSQGYAALSPVQSTYKSGDYDNNTSLINKGIDNYIDFN